LKFVSSSDFSFEKSYREPEFQAQKRFSIQNSSGI